MTPQASPPRGYRIIRRKGGGLFFACIACTFELDVRLFPAGKGNVPQRTAAAGAMQEHFDQHHVKSQSTLSADEIAVCQHLARVPWATVREIAVALRLSDDHVRDAITKLIKSGYVGKASG